MSDTPDVMARLRELFADYLAEGTFQLPPPIFVEMGAEFVGVDMDAKTLTVRFPVQHRFENPMGFMQGGMIAAAIDNTIGPLSFLVAPPSVTKTMEVKYRRPVDRNMAYIEVEAAFAGQEAQSLTFTAKVRSDSRKLLAEATAHHSLLRLGRFGGDGG